MCRADMRHLMPPEALSQQRRPNIVVLRRPPALHFTNIDTERVMALAAASDRPAAHRPIVVMHEADDV